MKITKRKKEFQSKLIKDKEYTLHEAITTLQEASKVKFVESLDCAMRLGVDPRQADQMLRGTVSLPHGTEKQFRYLLYLKVLKHKKLWMQEQIMLALKNILKRLKVDGRMLML